VITATYNEPNKTPEESINHFKNLIDSRAVGRPNASARGLSKDHMSDSLPMRKAPTQ